jgi:hypothetical protein
LHTFTAALGFGAASGLAAIAGAAAPAVMAAIPKIASTFLRIFVSPFHCLVADVPPLA